MQTKADADRVIERFDGFLLYGSRVRVWIAQRDTRESFWRRTRVVDNVKQRSHVKRNKGFVTTIEGAKGSKNRTPVLILDDGVVNVGFVDNHRRVVAVVDEEKLEILQKCAIGYCRRTYSMLDLEKEFREARLESFMVMRISGSLVLLMFPDSNKRKHVLEANVLDPWMENVLDWSTAIKMSNRRVWLFVWGVPIHAWSESTCQKLVELWGDLVSTDEETLAPVNFERCRFQVEMCCFTSIDEQLELHVDNGIFIVRVVESEDVYVSKRDCCCGADVDSSSRTVSQGLRLNGDIVMDSPPASGCEASLCRIGIHRSSSKGDTVVPNSVSLEASALIGFGTEGGRGVDIMQVTNDVLSDSKALNDSSLGLDVNGESLVGPRTERARAIKSVTYYHKGQPKRVRQVSEINCSFFSSTSRREVEIIIGKN
ncbi:hypothetical protein V6N12_046157 [Hibiscus sabdariffa]|uniref:DUF4283 domain-containing protein n=1 Tax=Hibiscus sabdariffa TaxID=183260 RepID=A0ABR2B7W9_9ROSI